MPISFREYLQSYTTGNTGGIMPLPQTYVPSQYPAYVGPQTGQHPHWANPAPSPANPALPVQPTAGRLVAVYYRDPATGQDIALNVDEAFYSTLLTINQAQMMTVYDAAMPCWANPATGNADFSLDEMTEAEKVIEEMKREATCA